jgi:hypothetical protein
MDDDVAVDEHRHLFRIQRRRPGDGAGGGSRAPADLVRSYGTAFSSRAMRTLAVKAERAG